MAAKCSDPSHHKAMAAMKSLSQTQFGRAALMRHGHDPMSVEEAREGETAPANSAGQKGS